MAAAKAEHARHSFGGALDNCWIAVAKFQPVVITVVESIITITRSVPCSEEWIHRTECAALVQI